MAWDARDALGGVRVGTLIVHDTERGAVGHLEIPAADLVPLLNSFSAIRALELQAFHLTSAGHDFLDFCQTKGIISAKVMPGATVEGDIDVDAIMRFCFDPVSKELQGEERKLYGFFDFHGSVVSRMHEVRFQTAATISACARLKLKLKADCKITNRALFPYACKILCLDLSRRSSLKRGVFRPSAQS